MLLYTHYAKNYAAIIDAGLYVANCENLLFPFYNHRRGPEFVSWTLYINIADILCIAVL